MRLPNTPKLVKRILTAAAITVALVYAGDSVWVRARMRHPKPGNPFETVTALRILAIGEKGNKTEYSVDPVQPQQTAECVHAVFPHNGDQPCWYLKRKFAQPIPMVIFLLPKHWSVIWSSQRAASTRQYRCLLFSGTAGAKSVFTSWQYPRIEITWVSVAVCLFGAFVTS